MTSIFEFGDYAEYLRVAGGQSGSRRGRSVSLAGWARRLGYRSPRSIGMVLRKDRLPTQEMIQRFSDYFSHSDSEHRYFELLVRLEKHRQQGLSPEPVLQRLLELNPRGLEVTPLDSQRFAFIAEWHYLVIKQLITTAGFRENNSEIARRLGNKVTPADVAVAIQTMLRLGILRRARAGKLEIASGRVRTEDDRADSAIRQHHRQMLERARESLEEIPVEKREITSKTLSFDPTFLMNVKSDLRSFKRLIERKYAGKGRAREVYQLNLQFFPLTRESSGDA